MNKYIITSTFISTEQNKYIKKIHYPTQHAANAELYSTLTSASWFLNSLPAPYVQVERTLVFTICSAAHGVMNSSWSEFTSQQHHLPSNQCCPLSSILLWILYSEFTNYTTIQNISQHVLFKSQRVCPPILPESLL